MSSDKKNVLNDDGENVTINYALELVSRPAKELNHYRIKELGLQLTLLGLAEVNAARVANLAGKMYLLEDQVFSEHSIRELEPKKVMELYKMSVDAIKEASEYVRSTVKSTDWTNIEAQLLQLAMDKPTTSPSEEDSDIQNIARDLLSRLNLNTTGVTDPA